MVKEKFAQSSKSLKIWKWLIVVLQLHFFEYFAVEYFHSVPIWFRNVMIIWGFQSVGADHMEETSLQTFSSSRSSETEPDLKIFFSLYDKCSWSITELNGDQIKTYNFSKSWWQDWKLQLFEYFIIKYILFSTGPAPSYYDYMRFSVLYGTLSELDRSSKVSLPRWASPDS